MRIAIVDVAAESGGAMSVLLDIIKYIESNRAFCEENQWILYTSQQIELKKDNIDLVLLSQVKKSWFHRIWWENVNAKKDFHRKKIDVVLSLQNTAFPKGDYKQIIYFHNVLLLESSRKYSLLKKRERKYAIYTKLIAPYTMWSLKNAGYIVVQTETVKMKLQKKLSDVNIKVIHPNVEFDVKYKNTAVLPIQGIVYPASAVPFKRIEEIIGCVEKWHDWFENKKLEVLVTVKGDENEYAKQLKKSSKDVKDIVKFIGFQNREDLFEIYKTHALFVCSELESFSIPFIEAAYIGTPIISAKYPYAFDCVKGLKNVFLYNSGNYEELINAINEASKITSPDFKNFSTNGNTWNELIPLIIGE